MTDQLANLFKASGWPKAEDSFEPGRTAVLRVPCSDWSLFVLALSGSAVGLVAAAYGAASRPPSHWASACYTDLPVSVVGEHEGALPFFYRAEETALMFTNTLDPVPIARAVPTIHGPPILEMWLDDWRRNPRAPTVRHRLGQLGRSRAVEPSALRGGELSAAETALSEGSDAQIVHLEHDQRLAEAIAAIIKRWFQNALIRRILVAMPSSMLDEFRTASRSFGSTAWPDAPELRVKTVSVSELMEDCVGAQTLVAGSSAIIVVSDAAPPLPILAVETPVIVLKLASP